MREWDAVAQSVLAGNPLTAEEALAGLQAPDRDLLDLLAAAYRVRYYYYQNRVKLNYLVNAKSGYCPEDCHYCSQSRLSTAEIPKYHLLEASDIVARARHGIRLQAGTCCIVLSGRRPAAKELDVVAEAARILKTEHPGVKICACLGLLSEAEARQLKAAGVDRYNHNLNTAPDRYDEICSTHTYEDRVHTVGSVQSAGISPCSGVIIGMGETPDDIVRMIDELRRLNVDSVPVNFLLPIPGTPLAERPLVMTPTWVLKVLSVFRLGLPDKEIRISAGREVHLRSLQPMALYAANALFVSDYLTEPGQDAALDWAMIEDLGFEIEPLGTPMGPVPARA
ncbi:MAG: biotin synthase BioB [Sulfobacillus sp.]|nr:biotin synthase BioB [Sulfobacillus sp.]